MRTKFKAQITLSKEMIQRLLFPPEGFYYISGIDLPEDMEIESMEYHARRGTLTIILSGPDRGGQEFLLARTCEGQEPCQQELPDRIYDLEDPAVRDYLRKCKSWTLNRLLDYLTGNKPNTTTQECCGSPR